MLAFARLGLTRKYKEEMYFRGWRNLKEFAATYSAVLGSMTNYKSSEQITALAEKAGLTAEFSYTKNFFSTKLLSMFKRNPGCYALPSWIDAATFPILKRLASITLILRQREVGQRRNQVQSVSSALALFYQGKHIRPIDASRAAPSGNSRAPGETRSNRLHPT